MKTIKITRPHWGGLAVVLVASITIGVALSLLCSVGEPMLAAKLGGDVFLADKIIRILAWADRIPWWATAAFALASLGTGTVLAVINRYGAKFAAQW